MAWNPLSRIPTSRHLYAGLKRRILDVAQLRLRFCSVGQAKSAANPGVVIAALAAN